MKHGQKRKITKFILYIILIGMSCIMLIPFIWMISSSLKLDKDVFTFPIQWVPQNPRWENYIDIWKRIPLASFVVPFFFLQSVTF